jgi:hypothetical protein
VRKLDIFAQLAEQRLGLSYSLLPACAYIYIYRLIAQLITPAFPFLPKPRAYRHGKAEASFVSICAVRCSDWRTTMRLRGLLLGMRCIENSSGSGTYPTAFVQQIPPFQATANWLNHASSRHRTYQLRSMPITMIHCPSRVAVHAASGPSGAWLVGVRRC